VLLKPWYWLACALWVLTGLPMLIFMLSYVGHRWPTGSDILPWLIGWLIMLAPAYLLPFARK
jgi:hypothetical protein